LVKALLYLSAIAFISVGVHAKDFGILGEVFEIEEPHLIEYFENKLKAMEESGRLDEINADMVERAKGKIFEPPAVTGLVKANEDNHYFWDPSVTAPQDYVGHDGQVVVKKGTTENPLDYVSLPQPLIFIDGSDKDQVDYAMNEHVDSDVGARIILTKGRPFDIMKERQVRVYFDQKGILSSKFQLKKLPSKITQAGRVLRVDEVALK